MTLNKIVDLEGRELPIQDDVIQIVHDRYDRCFIEIDAGRLYQYMEDESGERYYLYSDVQADIDGDIMNYLNCVSGHLDLPNPFKFAGIYGTAEVMAYLGTTGCYLKLENLSNLGEGIEDMMVKAVNACDCSFYPSERSQVPVKALVKVPFRFVLK